MTKRLAVLVSIIYLTFVAFIILNYYPAAPLGLPANVLGEVLTGEPVDSSEETAEAISFSNLDLVFYPNGHFYDSEIEVSIFASVPEATIHYTIDGSEPTLDSDVYEEPFLLKMNRNGSTKGIAVKAIAAIGEVTSRPVVYTYFLGTGMNDRFDTLIFSLSTDPDHLFDYDTGIFVEGVTRSDYIRENPRSTINPPSPANFNWRGMEGERPVYVEVFEPGGSRVLAQAAGIRAHGGWSRAASQKSIRLIARSEYERGQGKFHFDFFPNDFIRDGYDSPLAKYDQLILRNGGNDRDFGMLRNEVGYELARMAGLEVVSPVRPAAVFLNGDYYGFTWVQVRINSQYLEDIFNAPSRDFQIVGMGERWIDTDDDAEREAVELIHSFYDKNFTDDAVFDEFNKLVDIDQLLLYYGLQTFLGNHDWPNNNLKLWRYTGPQYAEHESGELHKLPLAPELDGRWRYVIFDLDWILGLYEDNANPSRPSFQEMMNPNNSRYSYMLNALFAREEIVDKFAMIMCDLAANIVTEDIVGSVKNELFAAAQNEIEAALDRRRFSHWVSIDTVQGNHANMMRVARGRSEYIFNILTEHFGFDEGMFTIEVTGAEAFIGTQRGSSADYFNHLTVPLRPSLAEHHVFDHWVVNGSVVNMPEITVSIADAVDGVVRVELATRVELPVLMFSEAYGSSERNGCVLFNPGDEAVSTDGMYLTNDLSNPFRWALPDASVEPGGFLEFAGRGSRDSADLHKIQMGFNARQGHRLFLTDRGGVVIATMIVS